ncbi:hypothetical protein IU485_28420 [Nocardia cyriacigeorgica]|uniref:hypothetical protein n=1 Tax=Nocardia cyriacigeorgica TaxID=135487 RepID=UPI0018930C39|nr:hypothetical protein [Nocardia cyriacigeorgica]MBF6085299.1 hypothetical protein [Nocardia cyriacigeorgica]
MAVTRITVDVAMLDGTEHTGIQTTVADQMLYARTRRTHKWDSPQDDMLTFINFLAYAALRRLGLFAGSWDQFVEAAAAVSETSDDVDPTSPVPSNG